MPDALVTTQRRISEVGDQLKALEEKLHRGEGRHLPELRRSWKRLQADFEAFEIEADEALARADKLSKQIGSIKVKATTSRLWFRRNPRAFALSAIAGLAVVQAVVVLLGGPLDPPARLVLHILALATGGPPLYMGLTRWADPSMKTTVTTYTEGRTHSGERVTIASGAKDVRSAPLTSILVAVAGLLVWGFFAGLGTFLGPSG